MNKDLLELNISRLNLLPAPANAMTTMPVGTHVYVFKPIYSLTCSESVNQSGGMPFQGFIVLTLTLFQVCRM